MNDDWLTVPCLDSRGIPVEGERTLLPDGTIAIVEPFDTKTGGYASLVSRFTAEGRLVWGQAFAMSELAEHRAQTDDVVARMVARPQDFYRWYNSGDRHVGASI